MRSYALLALALPLVSASYFDTCNCESWTQDRGWYYDWELTNWICKFQYGTWADYSTLDGNCNTKPGEHLDFDAWQKNCYQAGVNDGYYPTSAGGDYDFLDPPNKVALTRGVCRNQYS
ncbi:hypothetical protein E4U55_001091 [Claviceps digitariae]|nr:hypothetical protein E4U55_001091 [Claviceps digitariae]